MIRQSPSAEEKINRGKKAIQAFGQYRQLRKTNPQAAQAALDTLNHHQTYMGYGYLQNKEQLVPPIELVYWSFRLMVGFGSFLFALLIVLGWILLQTFGCCQLHRLFACHCYTALVTCAHYYQCGNNACDACHLNRA